MMLKHDDVDNVDDDDDDDDDDDEAACFRILYQWLVGTTRYQVPPGNR